jgi:hypothetical protein
MQGGDGQPLSPKSAERAFESTCDALLDAAGLVDQQQGPVPQQQGGRIRQPGPQAPAPGAHQQQQAGRGVAGMPAIPVASPALPNAAVKDMRSASQASLGSQRPQQPGGRAAMPASARPIPATAAAAHTASTMRPRPAALPMAGAPGASNQAQGLLAVHPAQRPGQPLGPLPQPMLATLVRPPAAGQPRGSAVQQPQPNIILSQQRPVVVQQPQTHVVLQQPWPIATQQPRPVAAAQQLRPQAMQQPGTRPLLNVSQAPRPVPVFAPSLSGPQLRPSAPVQAAVRPGAVCRVLCMRYLNAL